MDFEQFYLGCLSHASYLIGSEGVAVVVDPQRDVGIYLEFAEERRLKIQHVVETHLHADFVSGHRELADLTGAKIHLGAKAGAQFPHVPVSEGDEIRFGRCVLRFLETPGHTPESICVLLTDLDRSPDPVAVLTGDTLFIGDVGRPDLSADLTPQELAAMLYDSLHNKLLRLPDDVAVYPAHGAGSLCGRQMSAERSSTIGQQRLMNYALKPMAVDEFVRLLTAELPERPSYFAHDVEINRTGARPLAGLPRIAVLPPSEVHALQAAGAVVLDTRGVNDFGSAHIPGSIHIALSGQYATWAGIVLGLDTELILLADDLDKLMESRIRLARVGIERVAGAVADGIAGWVHAGFPVEQVPQIAVQELHRRLIEGKDPIQVVDVRRAAEWRDGHIEGAIWKPLDRLSTTLQDLDRSLPIAVQCKSGYRSSIASSLLRRAEFPEVANVVGGFDAWKACGLPIATTVRAYA